MTNEVLIVIPTLGNRLDYLKETLASIRNQSVQADIVVVTPSKAIEARDLADQLQCQVIDDPGSLPAAINVGINAAQQHHKFVNWLGDDDLLTPDSLSLTSALLKSNSRAVMAYGACQYIDDAGTALWVSKAGKWADRILAWGPDLIPQPGMLVRLDAWQRVGGLDETLSHAFDLDLLLKLKERGDFVSVTNVVSCFRWHPDSLTVSDRSKSLDESEAIKRRYLTKGQRKVKWLWEKPVRVATRIAATRLNKKAYRLRAANNSG